MVFFLLQLTHFYPKVWPCLWVPAPLVFTVLEEPLRTGPQMEKQATFVHLGHIVVRAALLAWNQAIKAGNKSTVFVN